MQMTSAHVKQTEQPVSATCAEQALLHNSLHISFCLLPCPIVKEHSREYLLAVQSERCGTMLDSGSQVGQDEQLLGSKLAGFRVHKAQGPQARAARPQQRRAAVEAHPQRVGHLVVREPAIPSTSTCCVSH